MAQTLDLTSDDPAVLARMADEIIAELKGRLAKFDAEQNLPLNRLHAEIGDARERGRWERAEDLEDQFRERRDQWLRAREPMIQEIMRIARAKEIVMPRTIFIARRPEGFIAQVASEQRANDAS